MEPNCFHTDLSICWACACFIHIELWYALGVTALYQRGASDGHRSLVSTPWTTLRSLPPDNELGYNRRRLYLRRFAEHRRTPTCCPIILMQKALAKVLNIPSGLHFRHIHRQIRSVNGGGDSLVPDGVVFAVDKRFLHDRCRILHRVNRPGSFHVPRSGHVRVYSCPRNLFRNIQTPLGNTLTSRDRSATCSLAIERTVRRLEVAMW